MIQTIRRLWIQQFSLVQKPWEKTHLSTEQLGAVGERIAADYLMLQHCEILKRDFNPRHGGQVDLVFQDRQTVVFCEVKTRTSQEHFRAFFAVDKEQQRRIRKSANLWRRELEPMEVPVRFDIIEVYLEPQLKPLCYWFKDAF